MLVKVEPSGCCVRKGMVQVRFSFYLEPGDARYYEHYIQLPIIPPEGYPGAVDEFGYPLDLVLYNDWLGSLPTQWQNNPFHNHFVYVEPDATDKEIIDIGEAFLQEAYSKWSSVKKLDLKNQPVNFPSVVDSQRLAACESKVQHLKNNIMERKV